MNQQTTEYTCTLVLSGKGIHSSLYEHMTFIQCRFNVYATSWGFSDVNATLYKYHVPAGYLPYVG